MDYCTFTTTRLTVPDAVVLAAAVVAATGDANATLRAQSADGIWRGRKAATWTAAEQAAVQLALDNTPVLAAPQLAQREIDSWPIELRALALALIDETNRLRTALRGLGVAGLPDVTPAQALAAVRAKAGTL